MNAAQLKALAEWWRMLQGRGQFKDTAAIEMEQRLNRMAQAGHEAAGQPSGMELTQIRDRREALARRRLQELLPERERERTLQGQLEGVEIPTVPGKELAVIPRAEKQARVYEYKNVPNIQVDPSGEAKIISDLSASIKRYREMKTGMEPSFREVGGGRIAGSRWEPERALAATEQAAPPTAGPWHEVAGYPPPQTTGYMTETQKRAAHLRKALADLKQGKRKLRGKMLSELQRRGGRATAAAFNPKIWDRNILPTGGPIQRQLDRRKY